MISALKMTATSNLMVAILIVSSPTRLALFSSMRPVSC